MQALKLSDNVEGAMVSFLPDSITHHYSLSKVTEVTLMDR